MKRFFHDFYGCTASIRTHYDGTADLVIRSGQGILILRRSYPTERCARIALGKYSDSWTEQQATR